MASPIYSLLADELTRNLDDFIAALAERIAADVPELTDDAERYAFARSGARSLMTDFVSALELGAVDAKFHAPAAAIALAQRFAHDDVPLGVMLRAYRLGQELVFERAAGLAEKIPEVDRRSKAVAELGAFSFRYIDGVMADVSMHYDAEREQSFRGRDARRLALVRELVAGTVIDAAEAERVLDYRVDGEHVAIVAWSSGRTDTDDALAATALELADLIGDGRTLVVGDTLDAVTVWVKPSKGEMPSLDTVTESLRKREIQAAIGRTGQGLRGLSTTKRQADLARAVAELHPERSITRYADVALAAVLLRDHDAARAFAADELGRLARDTKAAAVLRSTLAAFYADGQDQSRTARELGLHRNTVANRLRRAEELLGHPVDERVREIEAALVIVDSLPTDRGRRAGSGGSRVFE